MYLPQGPRWGAVGYGCLRYHHQYRQESVASYLSYADVRSYNDVTGVTITAPDDSPNTDGWDPDSSRNVRHVHPVTMTHHYDSSTIIYGIP